MPARSETISLEIQREDLSLDIDYLKKSQRFWAVASIIASVGSVALSLVVSPELSGLFLIPPAGSATFTGLVGHARGRLQRQLNDLPVIV